MAQFRGTIQGRRGEASRLGDKSSGLHVEAQSWDGKVVIELSHDDDKNVDVARVTLRQHHGAGTYRLLYEGPVSGEGVPTALERLRKATA